MYEQETDKIVGQFWNGMDEQTMNALCLSGLIELREDKGRQKAFLTPAGEKALTTFS